MKLFWGSPQQGSRVLVAGRECIKHFTLISFCKMYFWVPLSTSEFVETESLLSSSSSSSSSLAQMYSSTHGVSGIPHVLGRFHLPVCLVRIQKKLSDEVRERCSRGPTNQLYPLDAMRGHRLLLTHSAQADAGRTGCTRWPTMFARRRQP